MSNRKNHRREARRSVQKMNRAGVRPVAPLATYGACSDCHDYLLLSDGKCLACSMKKGR